MSAILTLLFGMLIGLLIGRLLRSRRERTLQQAAAESEAREFSRRFRCGTPMLGAKRLQQELERKKSLH